MKYMENKNLIADDPPLSKVSVIPILWEDRQIQNFG